MEEKDYSICKKYINTIEEYIEINNILEKYI
jgi:hypothetical protein